MSRPLLFLGVLCAAMLLGGGCQSPDSDHPTYQFEEEWGPSGAETGSFRNPIGIAVASSGAVIVSEAGNRRLQVFGPDEEIRRRIGPVRAAGDTLRRPMHVAATDAALYVPDFNTDRVHVLSLEGTPHGELGRGTSFDAPGGVAVDGDGRVYVADFYRHRVLRFAADGTLDRQWGVTDSSNAAPGRFAYPTDVAPLPDGGFVVADAYNHRIKRYGADDSLAWTRPKDQAGADSTTGAFNVATAVATDTHGRIYVADFYNHRIQIFSPDGEFVRAFGEKGTGEGQFDRPVDVAVDETGLLYVVDFGNDRIQTFRQIR